MVLRWSTVLKLACLKLTWMIGLLLAMGLTACATLPDIPAVLARDRYPGTTWQQYATPEEAGWSSAKLDRARRRAESIGSSAVMVVDNGAVVAAWGDVTRRYRCHSIRKSMFSALYGIEVHQGDIDLQKTLAELGIDDSPPSLTEVEKQARIVDLLRARSGVYHPAAYEPYHMQASRPSRGSYAPGQHFFYNNWDFNTLLPIFEQETGEKIFHAFQRDIAGPIGMQDFRLRDGYYRLEPEKSKHPAYPMRMSTRDLARFGLLFLRQGNWRGQQIVPSAWVQESTRTHSRAPYGGRGYGYMWWVYGGSFKRYGMYAARGSGGHLIGVFPKLDVVIVHRADTWRGRRVSSAARDWLLRLILHARVNAPKTSPELRPLAVEPQPVVGIALPPETLQTYAQEYRFERGTVIRVTFEAGELVAHAPWGTYGLIPLSRHKFLFEDSGSQMVVQFDDSGRLKRSASYIRHPPGP